MQIFRRLYGAHVLHLLVLIAALALAGYTISVLGIDGLFNRAVWWQSIAVWFAVAVIAHDLILFPLYALADRILTLRRPGRDQTTRTPSSRPPLTNYVRMPTLASGLLLVMFLPGIIEQGAASYYTATGLTQEPYLARWLSISAAFYLVAALWYAARVFVSRRNETSA
jgi:hypothetical protein